MLIVLYRYGNLDPRLQWKLSLGFQYLRTRRTGFARTITAMTCGLISRHELLARCEDVRIYATYGNLLGFEGLQV